MSTDDDAVAPKRGAGSWPTVTAGAAGAGLIWLGRYLHLSWPWFLAMWVAGAAITLGFNLLI